MDHIVLPPPHQPLEVPVYAEPKYDDGPFLTFPLRRTGKTLEELKSAYSADYDVFTQPRLKEALFQEWLFFGLLHEFLGVEADHLHFMKLNEAMDLLLNTTKLHEKTEAGWSSKKLQILGQGASTSRVYDNAV